MDTDELFAQMQEDERVDGLAARTHASPIDYARGRGIRPQKVYKALRDRKLLWDECNCGRRCIIIEEADALFGFKKEEANGETSEAEAEEEEEAART
jgi:hypothetical protein